jgi:hypothetical protein
MMGAFGGSQISLFLKKAAQAGHGRLCPGEERSDSVCSGSSANPGMFKFEFYRDLDERSSEPVSRENSKQIL